MRARVKEQIAGCLLMVAFLLLGGIEGGVVAGTITIGKGALLIGLVIVGLILVPCVWADRAIKAEEEEERRRQIKENYKKSIDFYDKKD